MQGVADLMGRSSEWVRDRLRDYAVEYAGGVPGTPLDANEVVEQFAPTEPHEDYAAEFEAAGFTPEVTKCLAMACGAAENALDAGAIKDA
jgi:hypothetical protein